MTNQICAYLEVLQIVFPLSGIPITPTVTKLEDAIDVEECQSAISSITGKSWMEFLKGGDWIYQTHMSYMSDEALVYYSPTYMAGALQRPGIAPHFVQSICGRKGYQNHATTKWDKTQKEIFCGFLYCLANKEESLVEECSAVLKGIGFRFGVGR
jgi:hypothetical protein